MNDAPPVGTAVWADAVQALTLLAIDPTGLGGASLRAGPGPVRDCWLVALRERLAPQTPIRRVPAHVTEQRLLGGLDLAATLQAGRPIAERGLLTQADGGVLVLAMAERVTTATTSHIASALDTGSLQLERDGLAATLPARLAVIALDEGVDDDERAPAKLTDRLAFHMTLGAVAPRDTLDPLPDPCSIDAARARLSTVTIDDVTLEAITGTALALGVPSLRAALLTAKAARAAAALGGRSAVDEEDASLAARLVLGPRATQLPPTCDEPHDDPDRPDPPPSEPEPRENEAEDESERTPPTADELQDLLLEAAIATIPTGLLAQLQQAGAALARSRTQGKTGLERTATRGGRPAGTRRGDSHQGGRLNVLETLRAAAPWQKIRKQARANPDSKTIEVRRADFHIKRTKQKSETATIFVVDASGSSALNRLAEAKGAVELLLADCYIRRDQVAVIAFRGIKADILLPPTRSLVRAKRALAALPGGGPTPLASAIDAAALMADGVRRKGQTPTVILLTDGRANIARDGTAGRARAHDDALASAHAVRAGAVTVLLIDTSPKAQPEAERLAAEMNALYLPLPYADATRLSKAVRAVLPAR